MDEKKWTRRGWKEEERGIKEEREGRRKSVSPRHGDRDALTGRDKKEK